jgi:protein-disulfide isomerase
MKNFYLLLAAAGLLGGGVLVYLMRQKHDVSIPANVTVLPADTAGFRGYILGADSAPVEVSEYADYQCPACQVFSTVQMPTIEERLIQTGRMRLRYRDFPLDQVHKYSRVAMHSAACAADQDKYWPQHHAIYEGQPKWAASGNPSGFFRDYARANGLDLGKYDSCMESGKFAGRIEASSREGNALGVNSTPTFYVGGRLYPGSINYDELKKLVDSLSAPPAK